MRYLFGVMLLCALVSMAQCEVYVTERAKGKSIPDPESVLAVASLLSNKTIVDALGLDSKTSEAVSQLMADCKGSLTLYSASADVPGEEFIRQAKEYRISNAARLNELLDPLQLDRLKQIAYQVEIQRVGLGTALCSGCLGDKLAIEDSQREPITKLSELADKQFEREINSNKRSIWGKLIDILDEEQKTELNRNIGQLFLFRDQPYMTTDISGFAIPDPEDVMSLVSLTRNRSVAGELSLSVEVSDELIGVSKKQSELISKASRNVGGNMEERFLRIRVAKEEGRRELLKHVSESTLARLRQIAFQVEIERMGIKRAMLAGRLATYLELSSKQRAEVEALGSGVEQEFEEAVMKARLRQTSTVLSGLHPTQLLELKGVLGDPIKFKESSVYPRVSRN